MDKVKCSGCGTEYDPEEIEIPEDASFYWEPSCPECHMAVSHPDNIKNLSPQESLIRRLMNHILWAKRKGVIKEEEMEEIEKELENCFL